MEVEDLFTDLADGKKLLKLLEIISGEKLGKPNNGKMRVHKVENVNKSLAFLHTKARCLPACLLVCLFVLWVSQRRC
jgi:Ca2+-binding actin-bundling protein fimbrin/plastin (EF-Hand superfamily)